MEHGARGASDAGSRRRAEGLPVHVLPQVVQLLDDVRALRMLQAELFEGGSFAPELEPNRPQHTRALMQSLLAGAELRERLAWEGRIRERSGVRRHILDSRVQGYRPCVLILIAESCGPSRHPGIDAKRDWSRVMQSLPEDQRKSTATLFRERRRGTQRQRGTSAGLRLSRDDEPVQSALHDLPAHLCGARAACRHELGSCSPRSLRLDSRPATCRAPRRRRADAGEEACRDGAVSEGRRTYVPLNTNGTVLKEEDGRALIAAGLDELRVSLDASNAKVLFAPFAARTASSAS